MLTTFSFFLCFRLVTYCYSWERLSENELKLVHLTSVMLDPRNNFFEGLELKRFSWLLEAELQKDPRLLA